jgi:hypothetical protein
VSIPDCKELKEEEEEEEEENLHRKLSIRVDDLWAIRVGCKIFGK